MAVTLNSTTLAAAVAASDDRVNLASSGTVGVGQMLMVDREAMLLLQQIGTSNVWLVTRGYSGTPMTRASTERARSSSRSSTTSTNGSISFARALSTTLRRLSSSRRHLTMTSTASAPAAQA